MANVDRPNGFVPVGLYGGGTNWQGTVRAYVADASSSDIAAGDMVRLEADGHVNRVAAGESILGCCVGVQPIETLTDFGSAGNETSAGHASVDLQKNWHDASDGNSHIILVAVGPDVVYEVQSAGTGGGVTDMGLNADLVDGVPANGRSIQELSGTRATTTAQLQIVDVVRRPNNELASANDRYLVRINEYEFMPAGTTPADGVGI